MSYRNENGKPHPLGDGWVTKILVALIALIAGGTVIYNTVIVGEVDENLRRTQVVLEISQTAFVVTQTAEPPRIATEPANILASTPLMSCGGRSANNCWDIDEENRIVTWIGPTDGSVAIQQPDSFNPGPILTLIKEGYSAQFTIDMQMNMFICVGFINGQQVDCASQPIVLQPGSYLVEDSSGESGGFCVTRFEQC